MKYVVASHAHHPNEGVYRLVYGEATEVEDHVEVENPRFEQLSDDERLTRMADPDFDPVVLAPTIIEKVTRTVVLDPQDVVWAADDPRWEGLSPQDIAAQQRRDVKEAIDRRVAAQERQQAEQAQRRVVDLGGAGVEL